MRWNFEVERARWIAERLTPFDSGLVTSVVPSGFAAYARVLHPVQSVDEARKGDEPTVRWSDVATWSGLSLTRDARFHDVALPKIDPGSPPPWVGGPWEGSIPGQDARTLAAIVRQHTTTPDDCWFCVWEGHGWANTVVRSATGDPAEPLSPPYQRPDPVPPEVRDGPRVRLPERNHLFYSGKAEDALALVETADQTANLWWPDDRAWCVASEIDLPWTYIGGSSDLIRHLLSDPQLEAQAADPEDSVRVRVTGWIANAIDGGASDLLATGQTKIDTACGSVSARLTRPGHLRRRGWLSIERTERDGSPGGSGGSKLDGRTDNELYSQLRGQLLHEVLELPEQ